MKTLTDTVSFQDRNDPADFEDWNLEVEYNELDDVYQGTFTRGRLVAIEYVDDMESIEDAKEWFIKNAGSIVSEAEVPYFEI